MKNESLARLLVKMTIDKAIREDKHPLEILKEITKQFELKRLEEDAIRQADSFAVSAN